MQATLTEGRTVIWEAGLSKKKQVASAVFAFLVLGMMMSHSVGFVNRAVQQKELEIKAAEIAANYSIQLVHQDKEIRNFAVTADVKEEAMSAMADTHEIFLQADDELASKQCILPVKTVYQNPQLPNGCEITSATTVLNYLGFNVSKVTMADTFLPKQFPYYNVDPNVAYMGNPHTGQGWYCLPGPIVTAVNSYLSSIGNSQYVATDITGVSIDGLKKYIKNGHPIVFWATVGFSSPRKSHSFRLPNGEYPYTGLHCLVLKGYDEESMYIADPLGITSTVSIERFTSVFQGMGSRAVLIAERG